MPATSTITVTVPATTANLGPGFDCIGVALSLYNRFQFSRLEPSATEKLKITVTGQKAAELYQKNGNKKDYQDAIKHLQILEHQLLPKT